VELPTPADVVKHIVYAAANPVKAQLVEKAHQWPGINPLGALLPGKRLRATRPLFFFRRGKRSTLPAEVTLTLELPEDLGPTDELLAQIEAGVKEAEAAAAEVRRRDGTRVVGRKAVLAQSREDKPKTPEVVRPGGRALRPRVASVDKWLRMEILARNKEFQRLYQLARRAWLLGQDVVFPAGTYWLRRFASVQVAAA